jgi:ABC-type amino acid transport system permease subunit
MEFIVLTIGVMLGSLLATVVVLALALALVNNKKVLKWYCNWVVNLMKKIEDTID